MCALKWRLYTPSSKLTCTRNYCTVCENTYNPFAAFFFCFLSMFDVSSCVVRLEPNYQGIAFHITGIGLHKYITGRWLTERKHIAGHNTLIRDENLCEPPIEGIAPTVRGPTVYIFNTVLFTVTSLHQIPEAFGKSRKSISPTPAHAIDTPCSTVDSIFTHACWVSWEAS